MGKRLFNFFYDSALLFAAVCLLPWFLYQVVVHRKYRESTLQRCGWHYPKIQKGERPLIWIHAVSVGETKAVASLANLIKQRVPNVLLVVSSITETGHAEAKRSMSFADYHVFLPFDLHVIVARTVGQARPDLVILSETDYWYNFIKCVEEGGGQLITVNAKISERSLQRYQWWPSLKERLFSPFTLFCIQSAVYEERLRMLEIPAERCVVTGNLKLDAMSGQGGQTQDTAQLRADLGIAENDQVIVIGSTHDTEEKGLLSACLSKGMGDKRKIILVPRHPERFDLVAKFLQEERVPYIRHSQLQQITQTEKEAASVILIDGMGLLMRCYQLADVAIVAGSYVTHVGGHNILEPLHYGVPVIFGPHMHGQPELCDLVLTYGAGKQVKLEDLCAEVDQLLQDKELSQQIGEKGKQLIRECKGAVERTWNAIQFAI